MNLPDYNGVPFDYEDFINNKLFEVEYKLSLIQNFWYQFHPATLKVFIVDCKIALIQLKAMARIPKKELKKVTFKK